VIKLGRFGRFYSCTGFKKIKKGAPQPEGACDYAEPLEGQQEPQLEIIEGEMCPECGKPLLQRVGRFGPFIGCSGYPDCRYIKKEEKGTGVTCPECGQGELVAKRSRKGRTFYSCNRYPECKFAVWQRPLVDPCPNCGGLLLAQAGDKAKCNACGSVVQDGVVIETPTATDRDAGPDENGAGRPTSGSRTTRTRNGTARKTASRTGARRRAPERAPAGSPDAGGDAER
jgi:DNA topoisomerase-1